MHSLFVLFNGGKEGAGTMPLLLSFVIQNNYSCSHAHFLMKGKESQIQQSSWSSKSYSITSKSSIWRCFHGVDQIRCRNYHVCSGRSCVLSKSSSSSWCVWMRNGEYAINYFGGQNGYYWDIRISSPIPLFQLYYTFNGACVFWKNLPHGGVFVFLMPCPKEASTHWLNCLHNKFGKHEIIVKG